MRELGKSGARERLDRKLKMQLRVFFVIFAIMVVLMIFHIVNDHLNPLWILVGLIPGLAVGSLLSRTKVLQWDAAHSTVVGSMDIVGMAIFAAYILFQLSRTSIVGVYMQNADLISLVSLAVTAGTMLGRVLFTLRGARSVLGSVPESI